MEQTCGSRPQNPAQPFPDDRQIAFAYVPSQVWNGISDPSDGLKNGTVFPELVKPFCAQRRRP
ncbi:MAG: spore coat associated protein CotJA [Clostridia bacterium]|nr:spore coat associated protein CotJA [Clostridia bacterium]